MSKPVVGIILSTTREGRFADYPAEWILNIARQRDDLEFELVDLRDYPLSFYGDDAQAASPEEQVAAQRWAAKMAALDGYIFITAEYNHGISGVLKNALDHAYEEYHRKPAAFIGYGGVGGARAVEQLRQICCELQIAPLRHAVHIGLEVMLAVRDGERALSDYAFLAERAREMLDDLAWWAHTLKAGRAGLAGLELAAQEAS